MLVASQWLCWRYHCCHRGYDNSHLGYYFWRTNTLLLKAQTLRLGLKRSDGWLKWETDLASLSSYWVCLLCYLDSRSRLHSALHIVMLIGFLKCSVQDYNVGLVQAIVSWSWSFPSLSAPTLVLLQKSWKSKAFKVLWSYCRAQNHKARMFCAGWQCQIHTGKFNII